jgi:DNA polymerase
MNGRDEKINPQTGEIIRQVQEWIPADVAPADVAPEDPPRELSFCAPSTEDILGAARSGVAGPMNQLWGAWKDCQKCDLRLNRSRVVLGSGNPVDPTYIFIGEAPGEDEDQNGGPFVGRAGQMLTRVLNKVGINRVTECYLMNAVCCRPWIPSLGNKNRKPEPTEMLHCRPRFEEQMGLLLARKSVKVICTLGVPAWAQFFRGEQLKRGVLQMGTIRMGSLLGWQDTSARNLPEGFPKIYAAYHPSYLCRQPDRTRAEEWMADFEAMRDWAQDGIFTKPRGTPCVA